LQFFLQSIDEVLEFTISFATGQPGNISEYTHVKGVKRSQQRIATTPKSSLEACILSTSGNDE